MQQIKVRKGLWSGLICLGLVSLGFACVEHDLEHTVACHLCYKYPRSQKGAAIIDYLRDILETPEIGPLRLYNIFPKQERK